MHSSGNSVYIWKSINKVLGTPSSKSAITELTINGNVISGSQLSNTFNDYLVNLTFAGSPHNATSYIKDKCPSTMFLRPTSENEVYETIMQLKNSNCCDYLDF